MGLLDMHKDKDKANVRSIVALSLDRIEVDAEQIRKVFSDDSLSELKESIRESGLHNPIHVHKEGDKYVVITGERRFRACRLLGQTTIDCIIHDRKLDNKELRILQIVENLQRKDLNGIELVRGIEVLKKQGMKQKTISDKLGITTTMVSRASTVIKNFGDENLDKVLKCVGEYENKDRSDEEKMNLKQISVFELYEIAKEKNNRKKEGLFDKLLKSLDSEGEFVAKEENKEVVVSEREKFEYPDAREFWGVVNGAVNKMKKHKDGDKELFDFMRKHLSAKKACMIMDEYNKNDA